ncbi:hypothetical protein T492DRAFT_1144635 [Pavlovales sp. CCMP2436]|nr:hypothetical protein T492DRAFT_1144635 [Pavlovales sp. CCMP2436]
MSHPSLQALGHSLFCSPLLSLLELRHSSLGDAGVKSLFGAFLNSTKKPFEAGAVGGSSEAARCFSALNLHDNEIGDEGASALGLALGSGRLAINELTLRGNLIGSVGASSLADGLIQSENALAALTELSLASNQIGDVGASALSLALANPGCALSKLGVVFVVVVVVVVGFIFLSGLTAQKLREAEAKTPPGESLSYATLILDLENNSILDTGVASLSSALANDYCALVPFLFTCMR